MTKKRSAKNAFISSLVVLCLCVTMLVGTTFAWYTDSVTSGRNTIVAGSLDMTLQYYTGTNGDFTADGNWTKVTSTTPVFSDSTSFEPGATQVAYVRVKNTGDLAFKYKLSIAVDSEKEGQNKAGDPLKLSDILYYGTEEFAAQGHAPYATRDAAINAVKDNKAKIASALLKEYQIVEAGKTSDVIAIVIYMPAETGNDANPDPAHKPSITFGLNALATQYTEESDTFGKTYDAAAVYPAAANKTVPAGGNASSVEAGGVTVTLPANTEATDKVYELDVSNTNVETDPTSGETSVAFDATLYLNDTKVTSGDQLYTMTMNIGAGASGISVTHNGHPLTEGTGDQQYQYNPTSGDLTIYTKSFSPFEVTYKVITSVSSGAELTAALAAGKNNIVLTADITGDRFTVMSDTIIDGDGHTITDTDTKGRAIWIDAAGVTLTLKNLTIDGANKCQRAVQVNELEDANNNWTGEWNYATVIIDDCEFKGMTYYTVNLCSHTTVDLTITDTKITGWAAINAYGTGNVITVKNSELIGLNDKGYNAEGWNDFATICLEGDTTGQTNLHSSDYTVTIEDTIIRALQTTGNVQTILGFNTKAANSTVAFKNCTFDIANGCHFGYDSGTGNSLTVDGQSINMGSNEYFDILGPGGGESMNEGDEN